jgi:hypothetical protein
MGEQRGKFNSLLQDAHKTHATEISKMKTEQTKFEAVMSSSIDEFRASTVTVSSHPLLY